MLSSPSSLSSTNTKDEGNTNLHSEEEQQQEEEQSLTNQQCYDNIDLDTIDDFKNNPPLESLCLATLQACQAMTPMIEAMYDSINQSNEDNDNDNATTASTNNITKTKADDSIFTIADGLVQYLLTEQFLMEKEETPNAAAPKQNPAYQRPQQPATTKQKHTDSTLIGQIVGEEDCEVQLTEKPYKVDKLEIPSEFEDLIDRARQGVRAARDRLLHSKSRDYIQKHYLSTKLTAFIDPIDGTKEFSTQKGDQCTICVGFASAAGFPVAGVVYRPLSKSKSSPTWAVGAKLEGFAASSLNKMTTSSIENNDKCRLLTTNGSISRFLETVLTELDYERYPSGGAGNKMLLLLEGRGSAYIQDRGVSRWDTCAAQAVLEAHGGILCKLDRFLEIGDIVEFDEQEDDEAATKTAIATDGDNNNDTKNDIEENEDIENDYKNDPNNDDDNDSDVDFESNKALDEIKPKANDEADYDYLTTSYKYFKTDKNLDFVPGRARLTKYNASKKLLVNDATIYSASKGIFLDEFKYHQIAMAQDEVKPYANLCGLVALPASENNPARRKEIVNGLREAAQVHLPAFD